MLSTDPYVDWHIHPLTKSRLVDEIESPWSDFCSISVNAEKLYERTMLYTRSDFQKLFRGNVRAVGLFFVLPERFVFSTLINSPAVLGRALNMDIQVLRSILITQPFKLMQDAYERFLKDCKEPGGDREVVVAKNFKHMQEILKDDKKVAAMLSLEGSHNLGFEYTSGKFAETTKYKLKNTRGGDKFEAAEEQTEALIDERVKWMKDRDFYIFTLNHFVYNHLATQPKAAELTGYKKIAMNPIRSLDVAGDYRGLTFLGQYFVEQCMQNRILLDLKHCDAVSRAQIYKLAARYKQPVIGSHIAFSGRPTNVMANGNELLQKREDLVKDRRQAKRFNPWDINFHDDDICQIHELGGIMGLILDERVLSSPAAWTEAHQMGNPVKMVYNQIEHAYRVLTRAGFRPEQAFDSLAIGSDFDGIIEPIRNVLDVTDLRYNPEYHSKGALKLDNGLLGLIRENYKTFRASKLEPEEIVLKIMRENSMRFLERHFV
ncbi:MAG: hypothetical protein ACOCZ8_02535 [Bacteroidota bacterium]